MIIKRIVNCRTIDHELINMNMRLHEVIEFPNGTIVADLPADNAPYRMYRLTLDLASRTRLDPILSSNRPVIIAMTEPERAIISKVMGKDAVKAEKMRAAPSDAAKVKSGKIPVEEQSPVAKPDLTPWK